MSPLEFFVAVLAASLAAGALGALLGLGGGVVVVPLLTLVLHIPIELAVGASIVSVIATSTGAWAATAQGDELVNLKVATFLQVGASLGALTGGALATVVPHRALFVVFGLLIGYSAAAMVARPPGRRQRPAPPDRLAERLGLHGSYRDPATGQQVTYRVAHSRVGLGLMYVAGLASGLLGIGSGALKVPAMDLVMRLPIKVSSATSNVMIGLTAATSAGVYLLRGDIQPLLAAPVALGVAAGAGAGARMLRTMPGPRVRAVFIVVLVWIGAEMLWKGLA